MNQREAVIEVMRANGGFATLGFLYREVLKVPGVSWVSKTPFKSINRIVQNPKYFFRIRPGLWALSEAKDRLPDELRRGAKPASDHTYYQGLLVEIGNLRRLGTYVPKQDQRKLFLGRRLGDMTTVRDVYPFTSAEILRFAQNVDVIWFNERKMPAEFIEVENTTDFNASLLKFSSLQDFNSAFRIVAPAAREREFRVKVTLPAFKDIRGRTKFTSYDVVSALHAKANEYAAIESRWFGLS
jgi:hypothetical protein